MSTIDEKPSTGTVEAELAVLDDKIKSMEAEVEDAEASPLVWDRINSSTAEAVPRCVGVQD